MAGTYARGKSGVPGFQEILDQDLKQAHFRPVYILAGDDSLRMEGIIKKIRKDALGAGGAFNDHVYDGETVDPGRVYQQAVSLPMLGNCQLLWVKHAGKFLENAASLSHFERYLDNPVKETILILTMKKADRRKSWVKKASQLGFYFEMANPTGDNLLQWIIKAGQRLNLVLDLEQASLLAELLGQDLFSIKNELDKIALMQEDRGHKLTSDELRDLVMDQAELQGYEITEHLMPGSAAKVLETWFRLAEWGRTAYEVSPVVLSRIRHGYLLEYARQDGLADQKIAELTNQNPWSFKFLASMINNMGPAGLIRSQTAALTCDRQLKSSPLEPRAIFEQTILEICRKN